MNFNKAEFFTSYGITSRIPESDRIEIAFAGRSNVGKSSLINKLLNRKALARVSAVPGKTVTINFYSLENIFIVDLPGYGYAKVGKSEKARWGELVGGYLNDGDRDLALVCSLVDMRHPPSSDDIRMINFLIDHEIPFIVVLTKADKLNKTERARRLEALKTELPCAEEIKTVVFSAQTGEGVEELRSIIEEISQPEQEADN